VRGLPGTAAVGGCAGLGQRDASLYPLRYLRAALDPEALAGLAAACG
jgi:hypothetical protein